MKVTLSEWKGNKVEALRRLAVSLGALAVISAIRFLTMGSLAPAGTGGTNVADTFSFSPLTFLFSACILGRVRARHFVP